MEHSRSMYHRHVPLVLRNLRVVVPLLIGQLAVYWLLNHYPPLPSRALLLTAVNRWIPFWIGAGAGECSRLFGGSRGCLADLVGFK